MNLQKFRKVFLIQIILIYGFHACGTDDHQWKFYSELLQIYPNHDGKYEAYVLIRGPICPDCPDEINRFITNNAQKENVLIIFYGLGDENEMNDIIKHTGPAGNMAFFLQENEVNSEKNPYPEILYVNKNKIRKVEYQNEKNPYALRKLEKRLAE